MIGSVDEDYYKRLAADRGERVAQLTAQVQLLDEVISQSAEAVGAYISPSASIEFKRLLPSEIKKVMIRLSAQPVQGVAESVADEETIKEIAVQIVRDVCETDPADPEHPETLAIKCGALQSIIEQALEERFKQSRQSPRAQEGITQAACDVLAERQRQIEKEGWTPAHDDDEHYNHELTRAAACYALSSTGLFNGYISAIWPWLEGDFKPKDGRRNLVRAGALILAEIERIDRQSSLSHSSKGDEHGK